MKIIVSNRNKKVQEDLIKICNGNEILAKILYNRGIKTAKDFEENIDFKNHVPYDALEYPPMVEACKMIKNSISNNEKIAVYGDYDVDGITATSILFLGLKGLNADVVYHVPDRFSEGYGLNIQVIESLHSEGVSTIITCDCGISNFNEIDRAKDLGMKVILTDHHTIGEKIPNADIVINYKMLPIGHRVRDVSGCATAYFLIESLYKYLDKQMKDNYLDLVALSIISDVIPLRDESRYLFKKGFELIKNPKRMGLKVLIDLINIENIDVEYIGFQIAPRLNAVGRIDTAKTAVELFTTDDEERAKELAIEIDRFNIDRKNIQNEICAQAKEIVESTKKNKKILVIFKENWHHGVLGIVAGNICEEYKKPCIVLTTNENGDVMGSARSVASLNIYETLSKFSDYILKFGGHSQAAGLSLKYENLEKFTKAIEDYTDVYFNEAEDEAISVDYLLPFSSISEELLETLALVEPYGQSFPPPKFATTKVKILTERISKGHHFMTLIDSSKKEIGTTLWRYGDEPLIGRECTVIYNIYLDTYNNRNEVKIKIEDILFDEVKIEENKVKFIDRRGDSIENVISEYNGCTIFYEGPIMFKPNFPIIDHKYNEKVSALVLYSLPKSNKILTEIIENTCPECVILNYSYFPKYDRLSFQKIFMGVVKNVVRNCEGSIDAEDFSNLLQVDKDFIYVYSKFLQSMGYLEIKFSDKDFIKYAITFKGKQSQDEYLAKTVSRYLREKEEYVKYMLDLPISGED